MCKRRRRRHRHFELKTNRWIYFYNVSSLLMFAVGNATCNRIRMNDRMMHLNVFLWQHSLQLSGQTTLLLFVVKHHANKLYCYTKLTGSKLVKLLWFLLILSSHELSLHLIITRATICAFTGFESNKFALTHLFHCKIVRILFCIQIFIFTRYSDKSSYSISASGN